MLTAAALLDAPDDPSGRGLLMVVTVVLVLALAAVHVRLLLRTAPRRWAEPPTVVAPALREPVDAAGADRADW